MVFQVVPERGIQGFVTMFATVCGRGATLLRKMLLVSA